MNNTNEQKAQQQHPEDASMDVTRSQNRQGAGAAQGDGTDRMGAETEDTGARPSNIDPKKEGYAQKVHGEATSSHIEGQYPQNGEAGMPENNA